MNKKTKNKVMKLNEMFANTREDFQNKIKAISALSPSCAVLKVYELWREYSKSCDSSDQSALIWEFVQWYEKELGCDKETLLKAVQS